MNVLRKGLFGASALAFTGYGATCYAFPEVREDHKEVFKAVQRTARFGWGAVRLAYIYKYSSISDEEKHEWGSTLLYNTLYKNGGLAIKLGQVIGSSQGLIPEQYITKMQRFFQKAKESSFEDVRAQIEDASGRKLEDMFVEFDPVPVSAASIAQVHIAKLKDGQKVAVKVQHRWLKEQCSGDIRIVNLLTHAAEVVFPGFKYKWYGSELKKTLPKELDFMLEAQNAERTREMFQDNASIRVPHVFSEFSNDRVMIMEYVEGVPVSKAKEIQEMGINLNDVAKLLNHCFSRQIFEFGHVHGDPHPGNLFISPQKDSLGRVKPVLTLLDHGLYQELTPHTRLNYSYLWKGILTRDEAMIKDAAENLGVGQFYKLLAAMVSRKDFRDIMNQDEKDYNKRLRLPNKEEQIEMAKQMNIDIVRDITVLMSEMNKDVLLLFRVNDLIRFITGQLGSPVKQYEIMAKYCFESIEQKELKDSTGFSKRFSFWFQRSTTLFAFKLFGFYYSLVSIFRAPNIPDEIIM